MTVTAQQISNIFAQATGSEMFFKRDYGKYMDYTEGVMNIQRECDMAWFIDLMYSHMPAVIEDYKETEEHFYIVELKVQDHKAKFTITRELYNNTTNDYDYIIVAEQDIEYTDLPNYNFKFFLGLASDTPLVFRLLCPSEY